MCVSTVNCLSRGRGPGCRCPASRPPHPMAAAVHLRSLHSLAHRPPAAKAAPRWLPLPARPGARRRGSRLALLVCSASSPAPASPSSSGGDNGASAAARWAEWIPRAADGRAGAGPEQVLRLISGAAATPVCQFVEKPRTFLHSRQAGNDQFEDFSEEPTVGEGFEQQPSWEEDWENFEDFEEF